MVASGELTQARRNSVESEHCLVRARRGRQPSGDRWRAIGAANEYSYIEYWCASRMKKEPEAALALELSRWELFKTHNFIARRSPRNFFNGKFQVFTFPWLICLVFRGHFPLSSCRRRTLAVKRHSAPQVDHDRLHRNLRFCSHQTYTSDQFTDNFLPGTKHMRYPRTNAQELVITGIDVGLVVTLAIIVARDLTESQSWGVEVP